VNPMGGPTPSLGDQWILWPGLFPLHIGRYRSESVNRSPVEGSLIISQGSHQFAEHKDVSAKIAPLLQSRAANGFCCLARSERSRARYPGRDLIRRRSIEYAKPACDNIGLLAMTNRIDEVIKRPYRYFCEDDLAEIAVGGLFLVIRVLLQAVAAVRTGSLLMIVIGLS